MRRAPEISVVLPVYRNRATLDALHARLTAAIAATTGDFELVFVDDCCPEHSLGVLRSLEARDPRVRVIARQERGGQMAALRDGLVSATGRIVVTMDADLQDPPEAIPKLLRKLAEGCGAVYAGRRGRYEARGRLLTSRLFKTAVALLTGMPADGGSFVAMRREVADRVIALPESAPYLSGAVAWAARQAGMQVTSIPVDRQPRSDGRSSYSGGMRLGMGVRAMGQVVRWRIENARRATVVAVVATTLGLASILFATTHGDIGWDGAWMLQVIARVSSGEVLYRDVFCGVPPLAVYAGRAATMLFGVELFTLRLLASVVVALSYVVAADLLYRLTGTRRYDLALAPLMFLLALPPNVPLYQPLANLFLLLAFAALTRGTPSRQAGERDAAWLFVSGAAAGLAFASKPNIGLLALASILSLATLPLAQRRWPEAKSVAVPWVAAALGFSLSVGVVLIPVLLAGGWSSFLDYVFLNKGTYLRVAGVGYAGEAWSFAARLAAGRVPSVLEAIKNLPLLLPVLAGAAAIAALLSGRRTTGSMIVTMLVLAELATLFPRSDVDHVVPGVAGLLVVVLFGWHSLRASRMLRRTAVAAILVVALLCTVRLGASAAALVSPGRTWSSLPHLKFVRIQRGREERLAAHAEALRRAAYNGQLFLLVPNAGLYYLVSGIRNPTPFDYPLATAFGRRGEPLLALGVEFGWLGRVCMAPVTGTMAPEQLQRAVQEHLRPVEDLGACTLYRRRD